jgi:hypothetical protein
MNDNYKKGMQLPNYDLYELGVMLPIEIEIELSILLLKDELGDLIYSNDYMYERELTARSYRRTSEAGLESYLNSKIPGREYEIHEIAKFIENLRLGDKVPICLHGSTGCGKTSIVK